MATPSSVTTIVRMTEPLSLLPLRLMHKAKELACPPQRTTFSPGEESRKQGESCSMSRPLLLCHPVAFNQTLTSLSPGRGEVGISFIRGGMDLFSSLFSKLFFLLLLRPCLSSGVAVTTHIPYSSEFGPVCLRLPDLQSQGRALLSHLWASFCQRWTKAHLSRLTWARNQS